MHVSVTSQSIFHCCKEGVSPAEPEWQTWCEGIDWERRTFLFFLMRHPVILPAPSCCFSANITTAHGANSVFKNIFNFFSAWALSGGAGEAMQSPDSPGCEVAAETQGWSQGCSAPS